MLNNEFQYYLDHQSELVKAHFGRFIVIKENTVIGDFGSEVEAIINATNDHGFEMGSFLVQQCLPGEENYTQFFHSRVMFVS